MATSSYTGEAHDNSTSSQEVMELQENSHILKSLTPEKTQELQRLLRINLDAARCFTSAAEYALNRRVKELCERCARLRLSFAGELSKITAQAEVEQGNLPGGTFYEWWLKLKENLLPDDNCALLNALERCDDAIQNLYLAVLRRNLGGALEVLLHKQFSAVKSMHDELRELRDSCLEL